MIEYLEGGNVPRRKFPRGTLHHFVVWKRVLCYTMTNRDGSERFCVVVSAGLKHQALEQVHTEVGHLGIEKTLAMVQSPYYWQNIKVDVINYVKNYVICVQYKGITGLRQLWQELPPSGEGQFGSY